MVQLGNFFTAMVAGSSIAHASDNVRRSASASAQADAKDALNSFQNLLNVLSNNIGSAEQLDGAELKTAFQGYIKMLQSVSNINQMPPNMLMDANATAFKPNWEGAAIGGVGLGISAMVAGALMGVTTQWSFAGLSGGIKSITGIDPMEILASGALGGSTGALGGLGIRELR